MITNPYQKYLAATGKKNTEAKEEKVKEVEEVKDIDFTLEEILTLESFKPKKK